MSRSLNSITIVAVRCRRALIQINLFEPFGREQVSGPLQAEEIVFHRRSYRFLLQEFSAIEDVALVIILADEPTGILDTTSVATVRDIPMVLARQRGRTSHSLPTAGNSQARPIARSWSRTAASRDLHADFSVEAWLGRKDSNLRMPESKSGALPLGDAPTGPKLKGFLADPSARAGAEAADHRASPSAVQCALTTPTPRH